jgi:hypothetical protein
MDYGWIIVTARLGGSIYTVSTWLQHGYIMVTTKKEVGCKAASFP